VEVSKNKDPDDVFTPTLESSVMMEKVANSDGILLLIMGDVDWLAILPENDAENRKAVGPSTANSRTESDVCTIKPCAVLV
jgi:hypothetical protein